MVSKVQTKKEVVEGFVKSYKLVNEIRLFIYNL